MAFRDQVVAAAAQMQVLRHQLARATARANEADARALEAEAELAQVRRGVWSEQRLQSDPHLGIAQVLLPIASVVGALAILLAWINLFRPAFHGHFDPTPQGIANFLDQLQRGDAVGGLVAILVTLALTTAPAIAALGVLRRRKWGWTMAVLTFVIWCVPCLPLGAYGLYAFCRDDIRRAFLGPTWAELADDA